jgi:hypothetical protein
MSISIHFPTEYSVKSMNKVSLLLQIISLMFIGGVLMRFCHPSTSHSLPQPLVGKNASLRPDISLSPAIIRRESGIISLSGEMTSIASAPLHDVQALVEYFDENGSLIAFETAPIAMNILRKGDQSPYTVLMHDLSNITWYRIRAVSITGHPIPVR